MELRASPVAHMAVDSDFWRGRRVLVTGHTGFKGAWLTLWLTQMGAEVTGLSDGVPTAASLYEEARVGELVDEIHADVRDYAAVRMAVAEHRPEVVFHMAAQALVRRSFADPRQTYETNVMGTVNVLEAVRQAGGVRVVVNVTSDKCYDNRESAPTPSSRRTQRGATIPTRARRAAPSWSPMPTCARSSRSRPRGRELASARAGNVIGGGDWSEDRLIPDIMRAAIAGAVIDVRNPGAVRPWQHVLNPLSGYLQLAHALRRERDGCRRLELRPR